MNLIQNPNPIQNLKSKIQKQLPLLALFLIISGQLYYLPDRLAFVQSLWPIAHADSWQTKAGLAYQPADYDLLAWVEQALPPEATLLLVTASPKTYGDPAYVLYHRAIYHLAPRSVWWVASVPPTRYPAWWTFSDLSETDLLTLARQHQATVILAEGFITPPVSGPAHTFDANTQLIFLTEPEVGGGQWSVVREHQLPITNYWSVAFLKLVGTTIVILMGGDLLLAALADHRLTFAPLTRLAAAWLLGGGGVSLTMLGLLWVGLPLQASVISLSLVGIGVWLIVRGKKAVYWIVRSAWCVSHLRTTHYALSNRFKGIHFLLFLLLTAQISRVAWTAAISPLTDWDAWVNWASKANLLFIEQALTPTLYNNPARLPTNMDYPLMLPLVEAWFYTWLGQISEPAAGFISLLFYVALLGLFYHAARWLVATPAALGFTVLLATVPRLERPAHSGLADIPLAALLLLAFLLLHSAYNSPGKRLVLLAGLAAGALPWLKSEGWLWLGLILLVWFAGVALKLKRGELSKPASGWAVGLYLGTALLVALPWPLFLITHDTIRFTFLPMTIATLEANLSRWPLILFEMGKRLLNPYWNFVWLFAGLTVLLRRNRIFHPTTGIGWLILPVGGYLFLISLTYLFSRFDPYLAHLNNSVERLLLQGLPLVLWWLVGQAVASGWVKGEVKFIHS